MTHFEWTGMEEFKAALLAFPDELAEQGGAIVVDAGLAADREIQAAMPIGPTGNLHNRVSAAVQRGARRSATVLVRSAAPHASLYERGTALRRTRRGANRGRMPARHVFVPVMQRRRRDMYEQLRALLVRYGLEVEER